MRQTIITVLTFTIVLSYGAVVHAQAAKGAQQKSTEPKSTTPATNKDTEQPSEVEQKLAEAAKRGEIVLTRCIDRCSEGGSPVTDDVEVGHALALPKPDYPALARAGHASGKVKVQVIIGFDGTVIAAAAVSGHPLLYAAAVKAARESEFTPTKWHGEPVKVTGVIEYNYVAQ